MGHRSWLSHVRDLDEAHGVLKWIEATGQQYVRYFEVWCEVKGQVLLGWCSDGSLAAADYVDFGFDRRRLFLLGEGRFRGVDLAPEVLRQLHAYCDEERVVRLFLPGAPDLWPSRSQALHSQVGLALHGNIPVPPSLLNGGA